MVYELTGSKLAMGTLFLLGAIPETILRLFGAPIIDRFNRIGLLRTMDVVQAVLYIIPTLLAFTGSLALWHLYAFAVAAGLARALYAPTYFSLVPALVLGDKLVRANSISQTLVMGTSLIGPALAGGLVALVGAAPALLIDTVSYSLSAIALFLLPVTLGNVEQRPAQKSSYISQVTDGIRFYKQTPALLIIMLTVAASNFGTTASGNMMIPYVREQLGGSAKVVGLITTALMAGIFLGGQAIGWVGEQKRRIRAMQVPRMIGGLGIMGFAFLGTGQAALAVFLNLVHGFGIGFFNPLNGALYQRMVPTDLQGRVQSVRLTIPWGVMPLASFVGSLLAERLGMVPMMLIAGLVPALANLLAMGSRHLRVIETSPEQANTKPAIA